MKRLLAVLALTLSFTGFIGDAGEQQCDREEDALKRISTDECFEKCHGGVSVSSCVASAALPGPGR